MKILYQGRTWNDFNAFALLRCVFILHGVGINNVLSQRFITPLSRKAYVVQNAKIKLEWKIDLEGQELEFARWAVARSFDDPYKALVTWAASTTNPNVFNTSEVESNPVFGEVTLLKPNPADYVFIQVRIDLKNVGLPLTDSVELVFVDDKPLINTPLPESRTYVENQGELTNQRFTFNVMGRSLTPIIMWKLNGENISQFNSFTLVQNMTVDNQVIEETLTIGQILPYTNGVLSAEARYGTDTDISVGVVSETLITYKYSPKYVDISTNISSSNTIIYTGTGIMITCHSEAQPYVTYQFLIAGDIVRTSSNGTFEYGISKYYSALFLSVQCFVFNEMGNSSSLKITYTVQNRTESALSDTEENWVTYFLVGCVVVLVALVGVSATLCVIRSRMRSMNIKHEANRLRERSMNRGRTDYESKAIRHNGSNHVYDLNQRGRPDGTQRTNSMSGIENDAFGLYDEF